MVNFVLTLHEAGTGKLVLGGENFHSGGTTISGGTLGITLAEAIGSGQLDLASSTGQLLNETASLMTLNNSVKFTAATVFVGGNGDFEFAGDVETGSSPSILSVPAGRKLVVSGTMMGAATFTKTNTGTVEITSGTHASTGDTLVRQGTLKVSNGSGSATGTGNVTVTNATLTGSGIISGAVTLTNNAVISPGANPGTLATGSQSWGPGAKYIVEINNATGTAGADPGWDKIAITGGLDIQATAGSKFTIDVTSLTTGNVAGNAANFSGNTPYTWTIVTTTTGITGFDASKFNVVKWSLSIRQIGRFTV